ncbi:MAG TPA: hypothetical protein VH814_16205 [Steroidobacteraceae bacterium]|jgi:hypothetical protein
MQRTSQALALSICFACLSCRADGKESIEFVAEHLPEIAMDNRYASLPLWNPCEERRSADRSFCFGINPGYARTHSGTLSSDGPMLSLSASRPLGEQYRLTAFVFVDDLALQGGVERRPLDTLFADVPLAQPVAAQFTGLDGKARDVGAGIALNGSAGPGWIPALQWSAGIMWQQVRLSDYRFDYLLTDGAAAGTTGTIDFSTTYTHTSPFVGAAWPRARGAWLFAPHVQFAMPLPRRGVAGRITGPGFDLAGNTADNGNGKHFGDPSVTIGCNVTYTPWHFTVDIGSTITQALVEPQIHEGVRHNLMLSTHWTF